MGSIVAVGPGSLATDEGGSDGCCVGVVSATFGAVTGAAEVCGEPCGSEDATFGGCAIVSGLVATGLAVVEEFEASALRSAFVVNGGSTGRGGA